MIQLYRLNDPMYYSGSSTPFIKYTYVCRSIPQSGYFKKRTDLERSVICKEITYMTVSEHIRQIVGSSDGEWALGRSDRVDRSDRSGRSGQIWQQ